MRNLTTAALAGSLLLATLACGLTANPGDLQATVEGAAQNYGPTLNAQLTAAAPTLIAMAGTQAAIATQVGPEVWAMETAAVQTADALRAGSGGGEQPVASTTSEPDGGAAPPPADSAEPPLPAGDPASGYTGGDEHDTVFVETLTAGEPRTATVASAFDAHNWLFGVQAGGSVTVSITPATDADVVIALLDPAGALVQRVDTGAAGVPETLTALVAQGGTYTARITTWATGDYTISVAVQ